MRWSRAVTTGVALAAMVLPAQSLARAPRATRLHVPQVPAPRAAALPAAWWQPGAVGSWQWQLTWPVDTTKAVQVYDIDYDGAGTGTPAQTAAIVSTLHAQGKRAICYLETGSWESYRPDAGDYAPSILGKTLAGFADERYVDIRQLDGARGPTGKTLHQILVGRFQKCKNAGFDGVETDLDDTYLEGSGATGFPLTKQHQETFNTALAADMHGLGLAWFLKNGVASDGFTADMAAVADGTVNEQCWQFGECSALKAFVTAGKPILNAEYSGTRAAVCPKAMAFPMATMRKRTSLNAAVVWQCF